MKKIMIFFIGLSVFMTCLVFAENKFTVSGDLICSTDANIYFCLYDQQTYPDWKKMLPPVSLTQMVKADPLGKASFTFKDVPKGDYVMIVFVDENGNGKLDCDSWGFVQEQMWTYKKNPVTGLTPGWHDLKFQVNENVSGILVK
jgi:uncharacterized protein (DUF2141 family)